MTAAPASPPLAHAPVVTSLAAGSVGAWVSYHLLHTHVLWRTRPALQPLAQALGILFTVAFGIGLGLLAWRLRHRASAAFADELRGLTVLPEGGLSAWLQRHPLISALVSVLIAYSITLVLHPPQLEIDDVYWWMYVAGFGMGSTPDEHLWCSHHLLARALAALYRSWPEGPWYGLYLQAAVASAHLALCYALVRRHGARGLCLFGLQFLVLDIYFAQHLQFTIESGLVAVAGVLLLALGLAQAEAHPWRHLAVGALLLGLASAIRVDACFLVLGVFGPLLLLEASPLDRTALRRLAFIGLVAVLLLAGAVENRLFFQREPDWRDFHRQFITLRQELAESVRRPDIDYTDATKPIFDAVQWSESDFRLIRRCVYYDDATITDEKVERVLAFFPRPWRLHPADYDAQLVEIATHPRLLPAGPLLLLLLLGLRRRGWIALVLAALVWCLTLVYFLNFAKPPPDRVYFPVVAGALWACGFFSGPDVIPPWRLGRSWLRTLRQFLIALTILIAAWNVVCLARDGREVTRQATELRESMSRLAARADNLYVVFGSHYPYHHILPFGDIGFMRSMKILGTLHNTGFNKRRMREFGVSDVYRALYERDDLFLISNDETNRWLAASIARHHSVEVGFDVVFQVPAFTVYQVRRRTPRPS